MKQINCNVSGTPTDDPLLLVDSGYTFLATPVNGRVTFEVPDNQVGGFTVLWDFERRSARSVLPLAPGAYEGGLLEPPLPPLEYGNINVGISPIRVQDGKFMREDEEWKWKGATDMNLAERFLNGEDIASILDQRQNAGANLVRCLSMGWPFVNHSGNPNFYPHYWEGIERFFHLLASWGIYCEWVVFAGTRFTMSTVVEQQAHFARTVELVQHFPGVFVELSNEWNHPTQSHNPSAFSKPNTINLYSHGSGLTDADTVRPTWDFATYHARRDGPPNARGFTNYSAFEFQADYPKPCPFIPDEGIKPEGYGYSLDFARRLGDHCGINWGGTFHSQAGVRSYLWNQAELDCAIQFYSAF